ncbi:MAG: amidase [Chitinophagales bacterium]
MTFEEYRKHDATALAELIKSKAVTPSKLLEIATKRAEEVNPKINAIVTPLHDFAREQLNNVDYSAPFAGVPYLIKDLGPQLKGTRYTGASRILKDYISEENSEVTNRILNAGLIIFGKTNTSEFGLNPFVENELFGATHNPWNLERTTGGSSGGSGAAVAAGIVPMASANDGGGSIRIPASCNGLFGMKATRGRVTLGPQVGEQWSGAVSEGCVSRSVRDSALYLDCIQGALDGDPYVIQKPERPYAEEIKMATGKLRIGYTLQMPEGLGAQQPDENKKAIEHTVQLLKSLGHEVVEVKLPFDKKLLTDLLYMLVMGELSSTLEYIGEQRGRKPHYSEVEPNTWLLYKLGRAFSAADFTLARMHWNEMGRAMAKFHKEYHFLLTPTLGMQPFKIGALQTSKLEDNALRIMNALGISQVVKYTGLIEKIASKIFSWIPYPPLANITGQPSMSVPLYWSDDKLPVGVMFTGKMNDEATMFRLAAQMEQADPWFNKTPSI